MSDLRTRDAAAELATSTATVRALIASGRLRAHRLNGESGPWRITPDALDEYRQQQTPDDPWVRTRPRTRKAHR